MHVLRSRALRWAVQIAALLVMLFSVEAIVSFLLFDRAEIERLAQLGAKGAPIPSGYWRTAEFLTVGKELLTGIVALAALLLARHNAAHQKFPVENSGKAR